jgi:5-methylcytosine-specific restriction endonuclease McrA
MTVTKTAASAAQGSMTFMDTRTLEVWVRRVVRAGRDVERALAGLREREQALAAIVAEVRLADERARTAALRALYWGCLTVRPAEIAKAFGLRTHELARMAAPKATGRRCVTCGRELEAASRAGLRAVLEGWQVQCPACRQRDWEAALARDAARREERLRARAARLAELRALPYRDYLQTAEWQATRRAALRHACYKCQLCGSRGTPLEVHHNCYERLGAELPGDVVVLCSRCHARHHGPGAEDGRG